MSFVSVYCCTKRIKKFSIANLRTSDWKRFKGPPSVPFGSVVRSNAVKNGSRGREVGAQAPLGNETRPGQVPKVHGYEGPK